MSSRRAAVGLYPVTTLDPGLEAEVAPYRASKNSVRLPYSKPIPHDLIERLAAALKRTRTSS